MEGEGAPASAALIVGNRNFRLPTDYPRGRAMARIICRGCERMVILSGLEAAKLFGSITG